MRRIAVHIEQELLKIPGAVGPYAERIGNKPYLEFHIDRKEAARYGIKIGAVQHIIMTAIGGMNLTTTVEGRERFPVRIRYKRELRDNVEALKRVLVPTPKRHPNSAWTIGPNRAQTRDQQKYHLKTRYCFPGCSAMWMPM